MSEGYLMHNVFLKGINLLVQIKKIFQFRIILKIQLLFITMITLFVLSQCIKNEDKENQNSQYYLLNRLRLKLALSSLRTTNVPPRISLNLPASIKSATSNTSSSIQSSKLNRLSSPLFATLPAPKADGYIAINSAIEKFSKLANDVAFEMLLIDSVIADAKFSPGVCINGGTSKILVTDAMMKLVKEAFQETGMSAAEAESEINYLQEEGELPIVGTTLPSPAILYNKLSGDFDHQVHYSFANNFMVAKKCPTNGKFNKGLKFTSDFKKISFGHEENMKVGLDIITMEGNVTLETSTAGKKRLTFLNNYKIDTTSHTSLLILEECTKGDTSGDCILMDQFYREDDTADSTKDVVFKIKGRINDNGGLVEFTQKFTHTSVTEEERELFDKDGILTGYEVKVGALWLPSATYPHLDIDPNATTFDDHGFEFDFPTVGVTLSNCSEIANLDVFVLVQEGENPDGDPTAMIGAGFKDTTLDIDYWGSASEVTTSRVWKYDHTKATFIETSTACKVTTI